MTEVFMEGEEVVFRIDTEVGTIEKRYHITDVLSAKNDDGTDVEFEVDGDQFIIRSGDKQKSVPLDEIREIFNEDK